MQLTLNTACGSTISSSSWAFTDGKLKNDLNRAAICQSISGLKDHEKDNDVIQLLKVLARLKSHKNANEDIADNTVAYFSFDILNIQLN